jgi:hypothetical protein
VAKAKFGLSTPEEVQGKVRDPPHSLSLSPKHSQGSELLELDGTCGIIKFLVKLGR